MKNFFKKFTALLTISLSAIALFNKLTYILSRNADWTEVSNKYTWRLGNIHYKTEGRGEPILLIHGIHPGRSHKEWERNISFLSKTYKVYAIDLLGFGYSDKPKTTYTAYMYATLINDFIKDVICNKTNIIASGHSCIFASISSNMNPDMIKRLVMISPTGLKDNVAKNHDKRLKTVYELPLLGTFLYNLSTTKRSIKEYVSKELIYAKETVSDDLVKLFFHPAHSESGNARYSYASYRQGYMNMNITNILKTINAQIFIIWGDNSSLNPVGNMEKFETILPKSSFYIFEKTRELPHFENYKDFNFIIKDLIR